MATQKSPTAQELWERTNHGVPEPVRKWIEDKVIQYKAFGTKASTRCTHCGQKFEPLSVKDNEKVICPHCGRKLTFLKTKVQTNESIYFTQQLQTQDEYQVIRTYVTRVFCRKDKPASIFHQHVYDWYVKKNGNKVLFSVPLHTAAYMLKIPFSNKEMKPMSKCELYARRGWRISAIYPQKNIQPWAKRMGFGKQILDIDNYILLVDLIKSPKKETLLKSKNYHLLRRYIEQGELHWNSVKIAVRHGYKFPDKNKVQTWFDYISMLAEEKKDILNPTLICPEDLNKAHDDLLNLINIRKERQRREIERRRMIEQEKKYALLFDENSVENKLLKSHISGISSWRVSEGNIVIEPLKSIQEFRDEGIEMHHCVFSAEYFKKDNSIILGARVNGERTETIEISTKDFQIVQCRGKYNQDSKYHNQIVSLIQQNIPSLMQNYKTANLS